MLEGNKEKDRRQTLRDKQPDKRYESQIRPILQEADTQRAQTGG